MQAPGEQPPGWNSTPFQQASRYIWLSTTEAEPRFRKILLRNPRRFRGLRMSCTGSPLCPPPFNPKGACSLVPRWFSVIAPHSFQLFELARLSTSFIVQYSSLEIFSISRAKLFVFVQRLVIAWISKLRTGKMEEIGKERGTFVRERVGTRFGFPSYALYLVLRVFETRGERGRIKALVLSQPSWEGLWRVSWQARVISKSYRGTWMILINRWKLYSSKSIPIPFLETRNNIHSSISNLELFFFELSTRGCEISKSPKCSHLTGEGIV